MSWTLDGRPAPFQSTETVTNWDGSLVRRDPNDPTSALIPESLGTIISHLFIVNAQYPDHDGVYTCTGSNDVSMINISSAMINIHVHGK